MVPRERDYDTCQARHAEISSDLQRLVADQRIALVEYIDALRREMDDRFRRHRTDLGLEIAAQADRLQAHLVEASGRSGAASVELRQHQEWRTEMGRRVRSLQLSFWALVTALMGAMTMLIVDLLGRGQ